MQNSRLVPVVPISTSITRNNCSKYEVYPLKIILELSNERTRDNSGYSFSVGFRMLMLSELDARAGIVMQRWLFSCLPVWSHLVFSLIRQKGFYSGIYTNQEIYFKAIMPSTELIVIMKNINQQLWSVWLVIFNHEQRRKHNCIVNKTNWTPYSGLCSNVC